MQTADLGRKYTGLWVYVRAAPSKLGWKGGSDRVCDWKAAGKSDLQASNSDYLDPLQWIQKLMSSLHDARRLQDKRWKGTSYYTFQKPWFGGAYPANLYGLSRLLEYVADRIGTEPGTITTISVSAHIYDHDWDQVENIIKGWIEFSIIFKTFWPCSVSSNSQTFSNILKHSQKFSNII